ncbi:MAG: phytanoyl-CoA dioxygenase family protein [Chloroflexota bacterium]
MAETDSPLKGLIKTNINDFASWLLDNEVLDVHTLNVELHSEPIRADHLFHVTLSDSRTTMLHIEFQGRSQHKPMRLRMLDYISRLVDEEPNLDLFSVVFYVGHGVGAKDTGKHQIKAPDGRVTIQWQYHVIRLWQMDADELLALDRPGLLPLVGQTQLQSPEETLPKIVDKLQHVPDTELQGRLFAHMIALVEDEEIVKMIEKLVESEELLTNTPYLRRIRQEGRKEGGLDASRRNLLDVFLGYFKPQAVVYKKLEYLLAQIDSPQELDMLFASIFQSDSGDDFIQKVENISGDQGENSLTNGTATSKNSPTATTPEPLFKPYTISPDEKEQMNRDGHLVLPGILTDYACQQLVRSLSYIQALADDGVDDPLPNRHAAEYDPYLESLIAHPQMLGLARSVLGEEIRFDHCVTLNRPGGNQGIRWHSHEYADDDPSLGFIRIFFYISGFDVGDGNLKVVPGSHLFRDPHIHADSNEELIEQWMAGKSHPMTREPLEIVDLAAPPATVALMWTHAAHAVHPRLATSRTRWCVVYAYRTPGRPSGARWITEAYENKSIPGAEGLMSLY